MRRLISLLLSIIYVVTLIASDALALRPIAHRRHVDTLLPAEEAHKHPTVSLEELRKYPVLSRAMSDYEGIAYRDGQFHLDSESSVEAKALNVLLNAGMHLASKDRLHRSPEISVHVIPDYDANCQKYIDREGRVHLNFDLGFIAILVEHHRTMHFQDVVEWLMAERLSHELSHDDTMGAITSDKRELIDWLQANDLTGGLTGRDLIEMAEELIVIVEVDVKSLHKRLAADQELARGVDTFFETVKPSFPSGLFYRDFVAAAAGLDGNAFYRTAAIYYLKNYKHITIEEQIDSRQPLDSVVELYRILVGKCKGLLKLVWPKKADEPQDDHRSDAAQSPDSARGDGASATSSKPSSSGGSNWTEKALADWLTDNAGVSQKIIASTGFTQRASHVAGSLNDKGVKAAKKKTAVKRLLARAGIDLEDNVLDRLMQYKPPHKPQDEPQVEMDSRIAIAATPRVFLINNYVWRAFWFILEYIPNHPLTDNRLERNYIIQGMESFEAVDMPGANASLLTRTPDFFLNAFYLTLLCSTEEDEQYHSWVRDNQDDIMAQVRRIYRLHNVLLQHQAIVGIDNYILRNMLAHEFLHCEIDKYRKTREDSDAAAFEREQISILERVNDEAAALFQTSQSYRHLLKPDTPLFEKLNEFFAHVFFPAAIPVPGHTIGVKGNGDLICTPDTFLSPGITQSFNDRIERVMALSQRSYPLLGKLPKLRSAALQEANAALPKVRKALASLQQAPAPDQQADSRKSPLKSSTSGAPVLNIAEPGFFDPIVRALNRGPQATTDHRMSGDRPASDFPSAKRASARGLASTEKHILAAA
ncbi:MAG: hypothetical protein HQ558_04250 [Candidatus Omnitrophica bacterium]|nr:hypothetical protein [Candidatus Omnitrophota bacterium]